MEGNRNIIIIVCLALAVVLVGAGIVFGYNLLTPKAEPVSCTLEARICPDGSTVGRTGPNCEFAECPHIQELATTTSGLFEGDDPLDFNALSRYFADKFNWDIAHIQLGVVSKDDSHLRMNYSLIGRYGSDSGGVFLMARRDGKWHMVTDGSGSYACNLAESYDFPMHMVTDCIDMDNPDLPQIKERLVEELRTQSGWSQKGSWISWVQKEGDYLRAEIANGRFHEEYDFFAHLEGGKWKIVVNPFYLLSGYFCDGLEEFPQKLKKDCIDPSTVFNNYSNDQAGFSIRVPKTAMENNRQYAIKTIESGNVTYVTSEGAYRYDDAVARSADKSLSGMEKVKGGIPWAILVANANDDAAVDSFIKERYGSGCSLGEKKLSSHDGVYDVSIKGDGKDLGETACPINYVTAIKYSPSLHRVAAWDIGQDCSFFTSSSMCLDFSMANSFKFIK